MPKYLYRIAPDLDPVPFSTLRRMSEYSIWKHMIDRCHRETDSHFRYYGGKGIKVCQRWREAAPRGFLNFLSDMGLKPTPVHSIERKDVTKDYEPENCEWIKRTDQPYNKSNTYWVPLDGKQVCLALACQALDLNYKTAWSRLNRGWTWEECIRGERD